jgi:hypothetical protein
MRRLLPLLLCALLLSPVACARKGGGDKASFCERVADVDDLFGLLQDFDATDPDELDRRFEKSVDEYRTLEQVSPREIKPDVAELGDVVADILNAVQRNGDDRTAIATDLADLQQDHPEAAAAALRVISFTDKECGITLEGGPPTIAEDESAPPTTD